MCLGSAILPCALALLRRLGFSVRLEAAAGLYQRGGGGCAASLTDGQLVTLANLVMNSTVVTPAGGLQVSPTSG